MELAGTRVAVTGAAGFVARHLCRVLADAGAELHLLTSSAIDPATVAASATIHRVDYLDGAAVGAALDAAAAEIVYHLAGFTDVGASWTSPVACLRGNVEVTTNVVLASRSVRRIVYASSAEVYGPSASPHREDDELRPASPYGVATVAAEQMCQVLRAAGAPPVTIARLFNVYGPGQPPNRLLAQLVASGLACRRQPMTSGRQTRDFLFVDDAVGALALLGTAAGADAEAFNVCSGEDTPVAGVAAAVEDALGRPVADLGRLEHRPNEVWRHIGDRSKLTAATGWRPRYTLAEGVHETIEAARRTRA